MKRLIIAIALLLINLILCFIGINIINESYEELDGILQEAIQCYEDGDMKQAAEVSFRLEKRWLSIEKKLSIFVNHATIDNIGISIAKLEPYAVSGQTSEFLTECKLSRVLLLHVKNDEKLGLATVL